MQLMRLCLPAMLFVCALPGHAAFKCVDQGRITYTDMACPGGKLIASNDLRVPASIRDDLIGGTQRAASDKRQLGELEAGRHRLERIDEQNFRRTRAATANRRNKCAGLALRKKWMEEDTENASMRSAGKTKKKLHRFAERFAIECPT